MPPVPPVILGKKVGMTQVYSVDGKIIPVTVIQAGPCVVMQVKTKAPAAGRTKAEGYNALQIGYEEKPLRRATFPEQGHARKAGTTPRRFVREIRLDDALAEIPHKAGDVLTVDQFGDGEKIKIGYVDITGVSKGKGFQGVMRRHGFGGQPASHGTERKHRSPGSIGGMAPGAPGRGIKKGKRMSGHTGDVRVTTRNHEIIRVMPQDGLLVVNGNVPGSNGGYVFVRESKTLRGPKPEPKVVATKVKTKIVKKK